jgi:RNA recognition motif-containing protein
MSDSPRQGPETRSPDRPRDSHVSPDRRGRSRSSHSRERPHHSRRAERERDEQKGNVVYVAKLSRQTRESDLNHGFKAFGAIKNIVLKSSFAFITFEKAEHATEAIARMNGTKFVNGEELLVEISGKAISQSSAVPGGSRKNNKGPQKDDKCFRCNQMGHWANDCRSRRRSRSRSYRRRSS